MQPVMRTSVYHSVKTLAQPLPQPCCDSRFFTSRHPITNSLRAPHQQNPHERGCLGRRSGHDQTCLRSPFKPPPYKELSPPAMLYGGIIKNRVTLPWRLKYGSLRYPPVRPPAQKQTWSYGAHLLNGFSCPVHDILYYTILHSYYTYYISVHEFFVKYIPRIYPAHQWGGIPASVTSPNSIRLGARRTMVEIDAWLVTRSEMGNLNRLRADWPTDGPALSRCSLSSPPLPTSPRIFHNPRPISGLRRIPVAAYALVGIPTDGPTNFFAPSYRVAHVSSLEFSGSVPPSVFIVPSKLPFFKFFFSPPRVAL